MMELRISNAGDPLRSWANIWMMGPRTEQRPSRAPPFSPFFFFIICRASLMCFFLGSFLCPFAFWCWGLGPLLAFFEGPATFWPGCCFFSRPTFATLDLLGDLRAALFSSESFLCFGSRLSSPMALSSSLAATSWSSSIELRAMSLSWKFSSA